VKRRTRNAPFALVSIAADSFKECVGEKQEIKTNEKAIATAKILYYYGFLNFAHVLVRNVF